MKEIIITGKWILKNGHITKDSNWFLIEEMINNRFEEAGRSLDGWTITYRDKESGDYWELSYPLGHLHGGGPPALTKLNK